MDETFPRMGGRAHDCLVTFARSVHLIKSEAAEDRQVRAFSDEDVVLVKENLSVEVCEDLSAALQIIPWNQDICDHDSVI